jgi:hypothetical protein
MKICKDCRWAEDQGSRRYSFWICQHPTALWQEPPDLVTGEQPAPKQIACQTIRCLEKNPDGEVWCGPEARYWEAKVIGFGEADGVEHPH